MQARSRSPGSAHLQVLSRAGPLQEGEGLRKLRLSSPPQAPRAKREPAGSVSALSHWNRSAQHSPMSLGLEQIGSPDMEGGFHVRQVRLWYVSSSFTLIYVKNRESIAPASPVCMVLGARLDPVPAVTALLALPEPGRAFEMVHTEIHRVYRIAPMCRGSRDADDRLPRHHHADPMPHQQPHQIEAGKGAVGKRLPARQGTPLVMAEFEREFGRT